MKFAINRSDPDPIRDWVAEEIIKEFQRKEHTVTPLDSDIKFVLNLTNTDAPEPFKRKAQAIFVVSIATLNKPTKDIRSLCYTTMVKTLSNIMLTIVPSKGNKDVPEIYFTTPEVGFYHYPFNPNRVYESILPLVSSRLVIKNQFAINLPQAYWKTTPVVEDLKRFGRELDQLGVLPSPFPLREVLQEEDINHLYQMFEVKGISYGNLSACEKIPEIGKSTFWMTARGVNKAKLSAIGKDILLVTGYDDKSGEILVSVPPVHDSKVRVSVDAIEHTLIYQTFPKVGAIVHVHAWMDNVLCTHQNYPCGTIDLAEEVVELLKQTGNPENTAVGLKNHGLTITGPNLQQIFQKIRGKLITKVPMFT